jgi:hypothetical protein
MFGYALKPNFTVENPETLAKPPTVDFSGLSTRRPKMPPASDQRKPEAAPASEK